MAVQRYYHTGSAITIKVPINLPNKRVIQEAKEDSSSLAI